MRRKSAAFSIRVPGSDDIELGACELPGLIVAGGREQQDGISLADGAAEDFGFRLCLLGIVVDRDLVIVVDDTFDTVLDYHRHLSFYIAGSSPWLEAPPSALPVDGLIIPDSYPSVNIAGQIILFRF